MYQVVVYVPEGYLHQVKDALFHSGAGALGAYSECSWEVKGWGQYRPIEGSDPFYGDKGLLTRTSEYRLEVVVPRQRVLQAVQAMLKAHPYEVPAYHVCEVMDMEALQDHLTGAE